jgi:hypothetical protein
MFTSHLLFADDVLLFAAATKRNVTAITKIFDIYSSLSGQVVNWAKSGVIFGDKVTEHRRLSMVSLLQLKHISLPFHYIGVPLFKGAPRKSGLQPVAEADKILSKFANWKGSSLSLAGRITLVNSVIQSSFLHSFAVYSWPVSPLSRF